LTEIYLYNVCSCPEILRRNGRGQDGRMRGRADRGVGTVAWQGRPRPQRDSARHVGATSRRIWRTRLQRRAVTQLCRRWGALQLGQSVGSSLGANEEQAPRTQRNSRERKSARKISALKARLHIHEYTVSHVAPPRPSISRTALQPWHAVVAPINS
jgi:hypothetical protein